MATAADSFALDRSPAAHNLYCLAVASRAATAKLQAFYAKYYANRSRTVYGASYSSVCWVYASIVNTYADQGAAHAALASGRGAGDVTDGDLRNHRLHAAVDGGELHGPRHGWALTSSVEARRSTQDITSNMLSWSSEAKLSSRMMRSGDCRRARAR